MSRAAVLGTLLSLALAAGACGLPGDDDGSSPGAVGSPATPDGGETGDATGTEPGDARQAPTPELQEYYDQRVAWEPCGDFQCATIEVPLSYEDPAGDSIELAVLKNPADAPGRRVGSLVVNPGGPGAPGTDYAGESASFAFGAPVRDAFDIIGFDPRGTGESAPLDCLDDRELDRYIAADPDPDDAAEVRGFLAGLRELGRGCAANGEIAEHVSTHDAARDMDVLRAVLGDERLNYLGASYGTKLGAVYTDLFPERAGRVVLDAAVDISLPRRQLDLQQAAGFETALTAYVDDCLEGGGCYLGGTRREAKQAISRFLAEVEARPVPAGDRMLEVGHAFYGIITPLYVADYWFLLDEALSAAMAGDGTALLRLSDLYHSRNEDGTFDNNASEVITHINCLDDPSYVRPQQVPSHVPAFERASPTFGRVFAWGLVGCAGLAVDAPERDWTSIDASGADPFLVIGTTRDPATPVQWARRLAAQLEPAVLVTRDGDGHGGYNAGNRCVDDVVEAYLIGGKMPSGDVDCPAP